MRLRKKPPRTLHKTKTKTKTKLTFLKMELRFHCQSQNCPRYSRTPQKNLNKVKISLCRCQPQCLARSQQVAVVDTVRWSAGRWPGRCVPSSVYLPPQYPAHLLPGHISGPNHQNSHHRPPACRQTSSSWLVGGAAVAVALKSSTHHTDLGQGHGCWCR